MKQNKKLILWLDEIGKDDGSLVGSKSANLGELYQHSVKNSPFPGDYLKVPYGFAVTATAYRYFMEKNNLSKAIGDIVTSIDTADMQQLEQKGRQVRQLILGAQFPADLEKSIKDAYDELSVRLKHGEGEADVAVRSSATVEDLPEASFAGQQDSFLHVRGYYELLEAVKKAFASLFTNRAISYRVDRSFDHADLALSICVQEMVRSDRGTSGVVFTLDTESGFRDMVIINAAWGLGELVAQGAITPDEYKIFKPTLKKGFNGIISKKLGTKEKKLIYSIEGSETTKQVPVSAEDRHRFALTDAWILKLARWATIIEHHYGSPMDIEWAYDAEIKELYIVQARRETVQSLQDKSGIEEYELEETGEVLAQGAAVGVKIGQGCARYIQDTTRIGEFKKGEVLVTEVTDPDWEPIIKKAAGIVTGSGSRTSHAAILARELGIPAVVGCGEVGLVIATGDPVTVSCAEGESGKVYKGLIKFSKNIYNLSRLKQPRTKLMMVVENPEQVLNHSFLPNNGAGLVKIESIAGNVLKVHPRALLDFDKLDYSLKVRIEDVTLGYENKSQFYLDKLAYGISSLAAAFYPKQVFFQFGDYSGELYARMYGGDLYKTHGNSYDPRFGAIFAFECKALAKVREELGLINAHVVVPMCSNFHEAQKIFEVMEKHSLLKKRGQLQVWLSLPAPSYVTGLKDLAPLFDGFCIDLSRWQFNNASQFKKDITAVIRQIHALGKPVNVCNVLQSGLSDTSQILVKEKVDIISVRPDMMLKTIVAVKNAESSK